MSQQEKWRNEYDQYVSTHRCKNCGSTKITKSMRGRPYMPYVQFHNKLSAELGYTTLHLSGCTKSYPSVCSQCKSQIQQ